MDSEVGNTFLLKAAMNDNADFVPGCHLLCRYVDLTVLSISLSNACDKQDYTNIYCDNCIFVLFKAEENVRQNDCILCAYMLLFTPKTCIIFKIQ